MKTALLFVAFPLSKSGVPDPASLGAVFQSDTPTIISIANTTKIVQIDSNTDLDCFQAYISRLNSARSSFSAGPSPQKSLKACWSDPFSSSKSYPSNSIESEILGTLWNYMSALQRRVLSLDSSNAEEIKKMRPYLTDLAACQQNFSEVARSIQHPVFSANLAVFIEYYFQYIYDFWQMSAILTKKEELAPKAIARCIVDIKRCVEYSKKNIEETAKTYFYPICVSIEHYLNAYIRFILGKLQTDSKTLQFGIAIAYFNDGLKHCSNSKENITFAPEISAANLFIKNALTTNLKTSTEMNKSVYYQRLPDVTPELPPPVGCASIEPNQNLLLLAAGGLPNIPSGPLPGAIGNGGFPPQQQMRPPQAPPQVGQYAQVPNFANGPPQFASPVGQPPQFTPVGGPPQFNPVGGQPPQFTPSSGGPPPQYAPPNRPTNINSEYSAPFSPPPQALSSLPSGFKEWDALGVLKEKIEQMLMVASSNSNPKYQMVVSELRKQLATAAQSDVMIQQQIDQYNNNPAAGDRKSVEGYVAQAMKFYTSVEERLNRLEATGQ